jgi:hypothetical protein
MEPIPTDLFLTRYAPETQAIANRLRALIRRAVPEAVEKVRSGWSVVGFDVPVGRGRTAFFAWVMPERQHVHLGFVRGVLMEDPGGLLGGRGITKQARWLTFDAIDEIRPLEDAAIEFVREAARIAGLSRAERAAFEMDRELAERPVESSTARKRLGAEARKVSSGSR